MKKNLLAHVCILALVSGVVFATELPSHKGPLTEENYVSRSQNHQHASSRNLLDDNPVTNFFDDLFSSDASRPVKPSAGRNKGEPTNTNSQRKDARGSSDPFQFKETIERHKSHGLSGADSINSSSGGFTGSSTSSSSGAQPFIGSSSGASSGGVGLSGDKSSSGGASSGAGTSSSGGRSSSSSSSSGGFTGSSTSSSSGATIYWF